MPTWDSAYLARLTKEAERQIGREVKFAWEKYPIAITSGTAIYTLPDYIRNITAISWKGRRLIPLHQKEAVRVDPRYLTSQGEVNWYLRSPEDFQVLRFVKVPNETITADPTNDDLTLSTTLENRVVISYYREPDVTGDSLAPPDYIARRLVKNYVLYRAFAREGKGQNLKGSSYYKQKYEEQLRFFILLMARYTMSKKKLASLGDEFEFANDMPRLQKGFNIIPGPFKIPLLIQDDTNNYDDGIELVLS